MQNQSTRQANIIQRINLVRSFKIVNRTRRTQANEKLYKKI